MFLKIVHRIMTMFRRGDVIASLTISLLIQVMIIIMLDIVRLYDCLLSTYNYLLSYYYLLNIIYLLLSYYHYFLQLKTNGWKLCHGYKDTMTTNLLFNIHCGRFKKVFDRINQPLQWQFGVHWFSAQIPQHISNASDHGKAACLWFSFSLWQNSGPRDL